MTVKREITQSVLALVDLVAAVTPEVPGLDPFEVKVFFDFKTQLMSFYTGGLEGVPVCVAVIDCNPDAANERFGEIDVLVSTPVPLFDAVTDGRTH